jgi:hypothetical protein
MLTFIIVALIMILVVTLGKLIASILPDGIRAIIGIGLGIAGPIYFFINWHWIVALIVTIIWAIICFLFIEGDDMG